MASFKLSSWLDGINTRVNKFRIKASEAINAVDVDLSGFKLKPEQGLDTTATVPGDYNFKGNWATDENASKFTESGDYLIKSYDDANAKFDRHYYDNDGNSQGLVGEKTLGAPAKPTDGLAVSISTASTAEGSGMIAQSSIFTETFGTETTNADTNTGLYSDIQADDSDATILKKYNTTLVCVNKTTGLIRRRTVTTGALAVADVTLTHKDTIFITGGYVVGIDSANTNISVCAAESGTTAYNYQIADPSYQTYNATGYVHGYTGVAVDSSSFTINSGNLFVAKNWKAEKYKDYQVSTSTMGNLFNDSTYQDIRVEIDGETSGAIDYEPSAHSSGTPLLLTIYPTSITNSSHRLWNNYGGSFYDGQTVIYGRDGSTTTARLYGCSRDITINGANYRATLWYEGYGYFGFATLKAGTDQTANAYSFHPYQYNYDIWGANTQQGYWVFGIHNGGQTYAQIQSALGTGTFSSNNQNALTFDSSSKVLTISLGNTSVTIDTDDMNVTSGATQIKGYVREIGFPYQLLTKPIFGTMTRINLASFVSGGGGSSGVTHTLINQSSSHPYPKGNLWSWRKDTSYFSNSNNPGGWDKYEKVTLHENTSENDEVKPLRSNFLATTESWSYDYSNTNAYATTGLTTSTKTHLAPEGTATLADIYTANAYIDHGSISVSDVTNKFMTYENEGSAATTDKIFFGTRFNNNTFDVYPNVTASGTTQFGESTAKSNVTLDFSSYELEKQDPTSGQGQRYIFIDEHTVEGSNINVVDMNTLAVTTGATTLKVTNARDVWVDGTYRIAKVSANSLSVIDTSNNNEGSVYYLPFGFWTTSENSSKLHYGVKLDGTLTNEIGIIQKCYAFWMHEVLALTSSGIMDYNKGKNRTITKFLRKNNTNNRHLYVIFADDNNFTYDQNIFFFNIQASNPERRPKVLATPTVVQFTGAIASANTVTLPGDEVYTLMRQDLVAVTHAGSGFESRTITSKTGTTITFNSSLSGSPSSGSIDCASFRWVHKNRTYNPSENYSLFKIPAVIAKADWNATAYASSKFTQEQIVIDTKEDWVPISKSSELDSTDTSGNSYFYTSMDKNVIDGTSNNDLGNGLSYVTGGVNLYVTNGANIPFQYKYSFLRDISHTSESEFLIEGPASDETSELRLSDGGTTEYIPIESIVGIPSEVTKVRIYRVGGEFAKYYWLVDLPVSSDGATERYLDTNYEIGSDLISPLQDGGAIPDKLKNIVYVNGVYMGSVGSTIYFSRYADPHNWPEYGYHELQGTVNNIVSYNGEGIVFTNNSIYRVRGSNYDQMQVMKIPDRQGVSSNNSNSVLEHQGSVYFISNDGLCNYTGGQVTVMSSSKFSSFPSLSNPRSAVKDNVLYIFDGNADSAENGVKLDTRAGAVAFSRISQKALTRAYYDQSSDKLYLKGSGTSGIYLDGAEQSINYESGDFNGGDTEAFKAFFGFRMTYSTSASGAQIEFYVDGAGSPFHTKSIDHSSNITTLYNEFTNYAVGTSIRYKLTGKITVFGMEINFEPVISYPAQKRFESVDIQYRGSSLQVSVTVDNAARTMDPDYSSTNLPATSETKNIRLYYPSDTVGTIPHYFSSGTGSVLSATHNTTDL